MTRWRRSRASPRQGGNRARTLQNLPANETNPEALAGRARIAGEHEALSVEVLDRGRSAAGMGELVAVSQGSGAEPRLIVLRYAGGRRRRSLARGQGGHLRQRRDLDQAVRNIYEMKIKDISRRRGARGGRRDHRRAELDLVAAIPATENMPSGTATRPGNIIYQLNGKTVEVQQHRRGGRLILAGIYYSCARLGANLVDLRHARAPCRCSTDLRSAQSTTASGRRSRARDSGSTAWRLPLHPVQA